MARRQVLEIVRNYTANTKGWQDALKRIDRSSASTAKSMQRMEKRMDGMQRSMKTLGSAAKAFAAGFAGAFSVSAIRGVTQFADTLANTADRVGVSVESLQALRAEAEKVGLSTNATDTALQRFARRLADARKGAGPLAKALQEYGDATTAAVVNQKTVNDSLEEFRKVLAGIEDPAQRVQLSFAAFDSEGVKLGQTLAKMTGTLDETTQSLIAQGRVMRGESVRAAAAMETRFTEAVQRMDTFFKSFVVNVMDGWNQMIRGFNNSDFLNAFSNVELDNLTAQITNLKQRIAEANKYNWKDALGIDRESAEELKKQLAELEARRQALLAEIAARRKLAEIPAPELPGLPQSGGGAAAVRIPNVKIPGASKLRGVNEDLANRVQQFVAQAIVKGFSGIRISSGFRSKEAQRALCKSLEGSGIPCAKNSKHTAGFAVDVSFKNLDRSKWEEFFAWGKRAAAELNLWHGVPTEGFDRLKSAHVHFELLEKRIKGTRQASEGLTVAQMQGLAAMQAQSELLQRGAQVYAETRTAAEQYIAKLNELRTLLDADAISEDTFIRAVEQAAQAYANATSGADQFKNKLGELGEETRNLGTVLGENVQVAFGNWIDSAVEGTFRLQDALRGLAADLAKLALRAAFFGTGEGSGGGILGAIGKALGFAKGGAFPQLALPQGVYNQPTFFPMPGAGALKRYARGGLLGEAGPEAILPLRRTASGDLGVQGAARRLTSTTTPASLSASAGVSLAIRRSLTS